MWYLDDGIVFAQSFTALNEALVTICKAAEQIGLKVNLSKCALVVPALVVPQLIPFLLASHLHLSVKSHDQPPQWCLVP